jgi:hypothetical protein
MWKLPHNKPDAEVHPEHLLTGPKGEETGWKLKHEETFTCEISPFHVIYYDLWTKLYCSVHSIPSWKLYLLCFLIKISINKMKILNNLQPIYLCRSSNFVQFRVVQIWKTRDLYVSFTFCKGGGGGTRW